MVRANWVLKQAQDMSRQGHMLKFKPFEFNAEQALVAGVHDASFAQQEGFNSQMGHLILISGKKLLEDEHGVHLVDWGSSKIHRVVRSTMAAESATAAHAHDRVCYMRTLIAELLHGPGGHWTTAMRRVGAALGTDCRSLVDHCRKTGASVSEKRVGLDIADVREGIDRGDALLWLPTDRMAADGLTKHLTEQKALMEICMGNTYRMKYDETISKKAQKRGAAAAAAEEPP